MKPRKQLEGWISHGNGFSNIVQEIYKSGKSWILYDWANSVYATNIMAVLFPIYFGNVCAAAGADNLVLWSYGTPVATFLVAVCAPALGFLGGPQGP